MKRHDTRHAQGASDNTELIHTETPTTDPSSTPITLWALHKLIAVLCTLATEGAPLACASAHVTCEAMQRYLLALCLVSWGAEGWHKAIHHTHQVAAASGPSQGDLLSMHHTIEQLLCFFVFFNSKFRLLTRNNSDSCTLQALVLQIYAVCCCRWTSCSCNSSCYHGYHQHDLTSTGVDKLSAIIRLCAPALL